MDDTSGELFARYRDGDDTAADELFHRYANRLIALARTRLSSKLAQRLDPEDIIQSAFRSFFLRARDGQYSLRRSGDLWRLLVSIALHKVLRQAERHNAGRRSLTKESFAIDGRSESVELLAREPAPDDVAAVGDQLEAIMSKLDPPKRQALSLRLQDCTIEEIATDMARSERTVRRWLDGIKGMLEEESQSELN